MRRTNRKSDAEIAREWDEIARIRAAQIESGKDISFHHVLLPLIIDLSIGSDPAAVLDIGCGAGFITAALAQRSGHVVGVDLSHENIKLAQARADQCANVKLVNSSLEDFAADTNPESFTFVVANMTLMTVVSLDRLAAAVSEMLKTGGHFVFTITHPCFWPAYWGYAGAPWFSYGEEIFIEAPFKISNEASDFVTTHIHRPIERYVNVLNSAGFSVIAMVEPMPKAEIQALYPEPWHFPRFLGMKCIKVAV